MFRRGSLWIGGLVLAVVCGACAQSDAGITTKVKARLESDRTVANSSAIQVDTKSKVVTLTGTADSPSEKQHVVELARQTEGVKDVVDNMTVSTSPAPPEAATTGMSTTETTTTGSMAPAPAGTPAAGDLPATSTTPAASR